MRAVDRRVTKFYDLLNAKDVDGWGRLWHPDAEILVPYPPDGFPSLITGRDTIVEGCHGLIGVDTNDNVAIFEFQDDLVRRYHDYFDPRRFQVVVDALAAASA